MFHKSKEEIQQIATDGAKLVKQLSEEYEGNFLFEYSPESFTGTEVDYAVEVCNAVLDIMQPTPERPMIINLPVTVEMSMPHVYANPDRVLRQAPQVPRQRHHLHPPRKTAALASPVQSWQCWRAHSGWSAASSATASAPATWMPSPWP